MFFTVIFIFLFLLLSAWIFSFKNNTILMFFMLCFPLAINIYFNFNFYSILAAILLYFIISITVYKDTAAISFKDTVYIVPLSFVLFTSGYKNLSGFVKVYNSYDNVLIPIFSGCSFFILSIILIKKLGEDENE